MITFIIPSDIGVLEAKIVAFLLESYKAWQEYLTFLCPVFCLAGFFALELW